MTEEVIYPCFACKKLRIQPYFCYFLWPAGLFDFMAVAASDGAEACVCYLTPDTGLAQSTVSHHLKLLVDSGLLERTQRGKWAYYSLTPAAKRLLK